MGGADEFEAVRACTFKYVARKDDVDSFAAEYRIDRLPRVLKFRPAELDLPASSRWFERAGRGELQDPRQPVDPVFCGEGIDIIFPRDVFEGAGADSFEFVGSAHDPSNPAVICVAKPDPQRSNQRTAGFVFVARATGDKAKRFNSNLGILVRDSDQFLRMTSRLARWTRSLSLPRPASATSASHWASSTTPRSKIGPRYSVLLQPEGGAPSLLHWIPVVVARAHVEFDRSRAAQLAGRQLGKAKTVVLVGAGAIGSLAAEALVREGVGERWTVIDKDFLLPHNQARHSLTTVSMGWPKAPQLATRLMDLRTDVQASGAIQVGCHERGGATGGYLARFARSRSHHRRRRVCARRPISERPRRCRAACERLLQPGGLCGGVALGGFGRSVDLRCLEASYYGEILRVKSLGNHLLEFSDSIRYAAHAVP